jgi:hypothetical protein
METKKLLNGIISAIIFIALAVGANFSAGFWTIVIFLALALHAGQIVWLYGRNWNTEREIKGGLNPLPKVDKRDETDEMDKIKTVDE